MPTSPLTAIVLAGGKAKPKFEAATGVSNRALVELAPGRVMLDYVLDALAGSSYVEKIVIVSNISDEHIKPSAKPLSLVKSGDSFIDNILIGFDAAKCRPTDRVLLVGADIPFIDPGAVDDYCAQALRSGADFCYPIVPMDEYNRQFAQLKRTTLKLKEGEFTGGNIMLVRAGWLSQNPDAVRAAYAARKSPIALGRMLGWGLLLRIVVSQIAIPSLLHIRLLETAVGKVLGQGAKAAAIITPHASIATDVDQPDDVLAARRILSSRML